MKKIYYLLLVFAVVCMLGACSVFDDDDEPKDDPALAESLIGLWRGQSKDGIMHVLNLRADRTAVTSTYFVINKSASTTFIPEWTAGDGILSFGGWEVPCSVGSIKYKDGTTLEYYSLHRIYSPSRDKGADELPDLVYDMWTGYYENMVIELEFYKDGTMKRHDKPNAGWEGEETTIIYNWSVSNNVIHISGPGEAWGVMVEDDFYDGDVIFVDFGDVASCFCEPGVR